MIRSTAFAMSLALGLTSAWAQSPSGGLPRLDLFPKGGGGKRNQLGYEGTPLAKPAKPEKKGKGQTEITALEASFDQKTREAVFIGNVVVVDPEFNVKCDRLTAFLKKGKETGDAPASESLNAPPKGGGLERAIAEANPEKEVVITQDKLESDGSMTKNVGRGRKADYDAETGDIILTGSPSVQQGINLCVATDVGTVMTLNRNGRMRVEGPHKTVIKDTQTMDPAK